MRRTRVLALVAATLLPLLAIAEASASRKSSSSSPRPVPHKTAMTVKRPVSGAGSGVVASAAPAPSSSPATSASRPSAGASAGGLSAASSRTPLAASATPANSMTPAQFLEKRLGRKFHPRSSWAGSDPRYRPIVNGRRVWEPIGRVRYLTIHHAEGIPRGASASMIRTIFNGHTSITGHLQGAADVGYHFFVDANGDVWEGRDADKRGTHVGSTPSGLNNEGNLGICGLGTYHATNPPAAMTAAMTRLCALLSEYYGRPVAVRGHKDWMGIARFNPRGGCDCPGRLMAVVTAARREIAAAWGLGEKEARELAAYAEDDGIRGSAAGRPPLPEAPRGVLPPGGPRRIRARRRPRWTGDPFATRVPRRTGRRDARARTTS